MADPSSPPSPKIDVSQVPDTGEAGPFDNTITISQQPVEHSSDTPQPTKRASSTEEIPVDTELIRSPEKRARENDEQDKLDNRPLKIKAPSSQSPKPRKPSETQSPKSRKPFETQTAAPSGPSQSTKTNEPETTKNEDLDSQSLGNLTCAICLSAPSPAVVTKCGHVTCGECLASSIVSQNNSSFGGLPPFLQPAANQINNGKCPVCRASLLGGWGTAMRGAILKMGKASS
ncbi:hypothetical protein PTTG_25814 [Puccinia triticina 1-1 BBBD Race 1]|uniref:RING-type domain-containing protein n=2 Tax=Puccinia triticina TaxID=208348 RepID=A0A180H1A0_PUCT1|nr:uncharacterized protein PtA15_10A379 [Puccinia triticina]OAV98133.1 hypothetical protein PTTG_25814 [Puccinia triticina 1-1 BBBD Race 1]WAQ88956.1 hypothetical protein PtA15_10A379 [Puccinia triticina]WAR59009.1 hypothetical protein PtB15_10B351 [Puccinia triticina]